MIIFSACQSAQGEKDDLAERIAREAKISAVIGFSESGPVSVTYRWLRKAYEIVDFCI